MSTRNFVTLSLPGPCRNSIFFRLLTKNMLDDVEDDDRLFAVSHDCLGHVTFQTIHVMLNMLNTC